MYDWMDFLGIVIVQFNSVMMHSLNKTTETLTVSRPEPSSFGSGDGVSGGGGFPGGGFGGGDGGSW